ncbi:hypothetical protein [Haloplanus rubicundus]|uniref:Uncharacterized protein n=1 Tax=Haloplanus rubicundus TaxID=1547898 RepID=A0A345E8G5_9EURY|nr:hypothetical protein [Haloplanus rubicundus]AXG08487.1 hypothetical protein DU484_00745 [Haloplanus rubicundus]
MPEIEICFGSEREYERLRDIRDKYGVQWRGMLIQGAKQLKGLHHPGLARDPSKRSFLDRPDWPAEFDIANADVDIPRQRSSESR